MPGPQLRARFTGHPTQAYLNGIPARDLTEVDLAALSDADRLRLVENAASDHAVYVLVGEAAEEEVREVAVRPPTPSTLGALSLPHDPLAGLTEHQRSALEAAGFQDAAAIRAASDEELLTIAGIGQAAVNRLRGNTAL